MLPDISCMTCKHKFVCVSARSGPDPPLECRNEQDGASYRGKLNKTFLGQTCQRWDQQTPHP